MPHEGIGWTRLTGDAQVTEGPALLYGLVLLTSVTGGDVTVYAAGGPQPARQVGRFEAIADDSHPILFPSPLRMDGGIYVDVGSSVAEVLILWEGL